MKIAIASDHAGFNLKSLIIAHFKNQYHIIDHGCKNANISVDYPDFAKIIANKITNEEIDFGILICGSGIGISIAANRFKKVRAALCHNQKIAKLSRQHNDANILCLGSRIIKPKNSFQIIKLFLNTKFQGNRHIKRVQKLSK